MGNLLLEPRFTQVLCCCATSFLGIIENARLTEANGSDKRGVKHTVGFLSFLGDDGYLAFRLRRYVNRETRSLKRASHCTVFAIVLLHA